MKKFDFRLEKVIKYRNTVEETRKQELAVAMVLLVEAKTSASELRNHKSQLLYDMNNLHRDDIYWRLLYDRYLVRMNSYIEKADESIKQKGIEAEIKRVKLVEASQEKRIIEKLKEKQLGDFNYERRKWEQLIDDEYAKYRYVFRYHEAR